ncbi:MAG: dipeptidase [Pseudomonadota bacterium]
MKKLMKTLGVLLVAAVVVFFALAPGYVERQFNTMAVVSHRAPTDTAIALHTNATIVDLHGDTLMWRRSILRSSDRGHIDLPRLQQGNVALQVLSSVTKSPKGLNYDRNTADTDSLVALAIAQRQPVSTWYSPFERSLWHARKLAYAVAEDDRLMSVRTVSDIDTLLAARASDATLVGGMLSIEGLHNLEGDFENLQRLFDAGFRMAGITHFFDNELAGSMHGVAKSGLTDFGRRVVVEMERLGMIVDLAHLSPTAIDDVLALVTKPVVVSHGGVQALCKVNRNLTDRQIRRIAATGGVIGIGYWAGAVCGTSPKEIAAAIKHVRDLVGIDHVGLGSDFDGAVRVSFDTSQIVLVTDALKQAGFADNEIAAVLGGNALRLFRATLPR